MAFASWKLAVILEGVVARHATGAYGEGDETWRGLTEVVVQLADRALELTGRLGVILETWTTMRRTQRDVAR